MVSGLARRDLLRAGLLLGGAGVAVGLAACGRPQQAGAPRTIAGLPEPTARSLTPVPPPPPPPPAPLPSTVPWQPLAGEVEPEVKVTAVRYLEAEGTWDAGGHTPEAAAARISSVGVSPELTGRSGLLTGADAAALHVIYPQYGGLTRDVRGASVMVVADHTTRAADGTVATRSVSLDVRLMRPDLRWLVVDVLPAQAPAAVPAGDLAAAVLANQRLVLPGAARADVAGGSVDPLVLDLLLGLAQQWVVGVQVLRSAHPYFVFDTDRTSNHSLGRAVDISSIDGVPVIDRDRSAWRALMEAAATLGADEIGGPVDLDGPRLRRYFSDAVHQDHVHLGFEVWRAPPAA